MEDMIKHQYMSLKPVIWNDVNFSLKILRFQLYQSNKWPIPVIGQMPDSVKISKKCFHFLRISERNLKDDGGV